MSTATPYRLPLWRRAVRVLLHVISRLLFRLLTRLRVHGRVPPTGPVIIAGNHVAVLEVPMMAVYAGRMVEIIGTDDIPLPLPQRAMMTVYGHIPIRRGSFDRQALRQALAVLEAGGAVGIFPEGGVWEEDALALRGGVAWLSQKAGVPVVPVGFGGTRGAPGRILRLQRPRLTINIGAPIYPPTSANGRAHLSKAELEAYTEQIAAALAALLPETDRKTPGVAGRSLLAVIAADGSTLYESETLGGILFHTRLMEIMHDTLKLPVASLRVYDTPQPASEVAAALAAALRYSDEDAAFFDYRLGRPRMRAMQDDLRALAALLAATPGLVTLRRVPLS